MKKILLSVFGSALLTSSVGLTAGQNVSTSVKLTEKQQTINQKFLSEAYLINNQSALDESKIITLQSISQNWDDEAISKELNSALEYKGNQLVINKSKLNVNKLPIEVLKHLDLALSNLNNEVNFGNIKVNVTNENLVQLIYSNNDNNDQQVSAYSSYMWFSNYKPAHWWNWWKVWEFGYYMHFNETAVQNAKIINMLAGLINIVFFFKNLSKLDKMINTLSIAKVSGDTATIKKLLPEFSQLLGGVSSDTLGYLLDILSSLSIAVSFLIALTSTGWGAVATAIISLVLSALEKITGDMVKADLGHGVKWQWPLYIIPGKMTAE